jgi:hypothetical protein
MLYFRTDIWITPDLKNSCPARALASCIFELQFPQAVCTKTTIKQFTDVLNFVQVQLHRMALAFRTAIRLALELGATTLTWNAFMFDHATKIQQIRILSYKKGSRFFCSL